VLRSIRAGAFFAAVVVALLAWASLASAKAILFPNVLKEKQHDQAAGAIVPPAPPCPQNVLGISCTPIPETPALGVPFPGNMAYYGGHVQVHPKEYLVYWGWGQNGAWPAGTACSPETITEGSLSATLACDPDGAGKYMADFLQQIGGTSWAGVSTQFYETDSSGAQTPVSNDPNLLAGIWVDDTDPNTLPTTNMSNPAGSTNTLSVLGREAQAAVQHFGITDLNDANIVIVQPPGLSDPNAISQGYCAFHDYLWPGVESGAYNGLQQGIAYSNIPYQLAINSNGSNVCGENAVNSGAQGKLDGFSIVLGHEMEETITDPGAEDVVGSGLTPTHLGGWYDVLDANENGDKCAWVGLNVLTGQGTFPIPGALGDITGNGGETFAVQSLWSDSALLGAGYCAGVNDLPSPLG
jgi:serine protease